MINVIIIDDDEFARNILKKEIISNFNEFDIIAEGEDVASGLEIINKNNPDIVFLDIDMPDGTGFDLLKKLTNINFKLVFITAHSEFAIKAIKFSAIDYVLKPFDSSEIIQTLTKLKDIFEKENEQIKIKTFLNNLDNITNSKKKIVLKTSDNIYVVDVQDIVRCLSENNYTTFFINNNTKIVISKTLKEYEMLLDEFGFIRVHRSHLININYVKRFAKESNYLYMKDNSVIPVSHRKKELLLSIFENL